MSLRELVAGRPDSGSDGVEIADEELFSVAFEIEEHDAIAELGVAGDDASANMEGAIVEPESGLDVGAQDQRFDQMHIAAASTEIGSFQAQGSGRVFLAKVDRDLHGGTRMQPAIGVSERGAQKLFVGEVHGISFGSGIEDTAPKLAAKGRAPALSLESCRANLIAASFVTQNRGTRTRICNWYAEPSS